MIKYIVIALLLSTAAQAAPVSKQDMKDAVSRDQLIKELTAPPKSALNICRGC